MKPIKSILVLALVLVPGVAAAQGYYGRGGGGYYAQPNPIPGGFHDRTGRLMFGFGLGLGYMNDNGDRVTCNGCDATPLTGEGNFHVGGMLSPRFALMLEIQGNIQQIAYNSVQDATLSQTLVMGAGQFWLTPQLWIKGGIGVAHLDVNDNLNGVYYPQADGLALLGGVGFELLSARFFAVDLQGRLSEGSYHGTGDHVTTGSIGVGINWY